MLSMMLVLILAAPATTEIWNDGFLVSIRDTADTITTGAVTSGAGGYGNIRNTQVYSRTVVDFYLTVRVTMDGADYLVDGLFSPRPYFAFSHIHVPNVVENDAIQYRIKDKDLFVRERDGKEIKLRIVKTRKP